MGGRHYAREFEREAVHLVVNRGVSVAQAARDLDLHPSLLWRWIRQFNESGDKAFHGQGKLTSSNEDVRQLRRELARLKAERDILKKPQPTSPRTNSSVRVHCETPGNMAG